MDLADRIRELRRAGLGRRAIAAALDLEPEDVTSQALDPSYQPPVAYLFSDDAEVNPFGTEWVWDTDSSLPDYGTLDPEDTSRIVYSQTGLYLYNFYLLVMGADPQPADPQTPVVQARLTGTAAGWTAPSEWLRPGQGVAFTIMVPVRSVDRYTRLFVTPIGEFSSLTVHAEAMLVRIGSL